MFCSAVGAPTRALLRSWRSLRAASGNFSITAVASSLIATPIHEIPPTTIARTSAAPTLRGTRHAASQSTSGRSA
jgi:hypothetical protein